MAWFRGEVCAGSGGRPRESHACTAAGITHAIATATAPIQPHGSGPRSQSQRCCCARTRRQDSCSECGGVDANARALLPAHLPTRAERPLLCAYATRNIYILLPHPGPLHLGQSARARSPLAAAQRQQHSEGWEHDARQCTPETHRTHPVPTPLPVPAHHLVVDVCRLCCQWRRLRAALPVSAALLVESSQTPFDLNFCFGGKLEENLRKEAGAVGLQLGKGAMRR